MKCCNAVVRCLDLSPPHPQQWLEFATDNFIIIADFFAVCKSTILKTSLPSKLCIPHLIPGYRRMNELATRHSMKWSSSHLSPICPAWAGLSLISDSDQPQPRGPRVVTSDNLSPESREGQSWKRGRGHTAWRNTDKLFEQEFTIYTPTNWVIGARGELCEWHWLICI